MKKGIIFAVLFIIFQSSLLCAEVLSIPCSALLPVDHNVEYNCNGLRLQTANNQIQDFTAPVLLPTGSSISGFELEAKDDAGGWIPGGYVRLELLGPSINSWGLVETIQTSGTEAPGDIKINKLIDPPITVDNINYSYHIAVRLWNSAAGAYSTWFYKARIYYDPPANAGQSKVVVIPLFE